MIDPADKDRSALVFAPLGLTAAGVVVVLLNPPDFDGIPGGAAYVAAGVLGQLLLLVRRLGRLSLEPTGGVVLVLPWLAFFAIWIVLLPATGSPHFPDNPVFLSISGGWFIVIAADFVRRDVPDQRLALLRAISCLPRSKVGAAGDVRRFDNSGRKDEEWLKLVIQAVLLVALAAWSSVVFFGKGALQPALVTDLAAAVRINYVTAGIVVCGWEVFGRLRDYLAEL